MQMPHIQLNFTHEERLQMGIKEWIVFYRCFVQIRIAKGEVDYLNRLVNLLWELSGKPFYDCSDLSAEI